MLSTLEACGVLECMPISVPTAVRVTRSHLACREDESEGLWEEVGLVRGGVEALLRSRGKCECLPRLQLLASEGI